MAETTLGVAARSDRFVIGEPSPVSPSARKYVVPSCRMRISLQPQSNTELSLSTHDRDFARFKGLRLEYPLVDLR